MKSVPSGSLQKTFSHVTAQFQTPPISSHVNALTFSRHRPLRYNKLNLWNFQNIWSCITLLSYFRFSHNLYVHLGHPKEIKYARKRFKIWYGKTTPPIWAIYFWVGTVINTYIWFAELGNLALSFSFTLVKANSIFDIFCKLIWQRYYCTGVPTWRKTNKSIFKI